MFCYISLFACVWPLQNSGQLGCRLKADGQNTLSNKTDHKHDLQMHLYVNEQKKINNAGSKTGLKIL